MGIGLHNLDAAGSGSATSDDAVVEESIYASSPECHGGGDDDLPHASSAEHRDADPQFIITLIRNEQGDL